MRQHVHCGEENPPAPAKSELPNSLCVSILSFPKKWGVYSVIIHKVMLCCSPWRTNPDLAQQLPPGKWTRSSGSVEWLPCFIRAWRDTFYCQVSFSSALGMKSKKENKNTVYPPIQNRLQWKKMNSKQPFSNDSFLFPNALKGEGLHPKSPNHFGNRSSWTSRINLNLCTRCVL